MWDWFSFMGLALDIVGFCILIYEAAKSAFLPVDVKYIPFWVGGHATTEIENYHYGRSHYFSLAAGLILAGFVMQFFGAIPDKYREALIHPFWFILISASVGLAASIIVGLVISQTRMLAEEASDEARRASEVSKGA